MNFYLGIDFGTSGARACAIDEEGNIHSSTQYLFPVSASKDWARSWESALFNLIDSLPRRVREEIRTIAINGTSSTVLLCSGQGDPVAPPLLYNDGVGVAVLDKLKASAPSHHLVVSTSSSLAKLLWWYEQPFYTQAQYFLHQADWLAFLLHGKLGITDYHNCLKLGYDVEQLAYPSWIQALPIQIILPQVLPPGTPVDVVQKSIRERFNLPGDCLICTGTTDSIAAFIASGAKLPGEAVTSLGSTLVLKLLSQKRVEDSRYGIYSHRFEQGEEVLWLTGGASNTGGAVLRHFFSNEELSSLSQKIEVNKKSDLNYYPLLKCGERFPINNPSLPPKLTPRPENKVEFLHGLLDSIARIEAEGYSLLQQLRATPLTRVYTAGGGAKNGTWTVIRQDHLQVPVTSSMNTDAAYGSALLAQQR
ncbi:MAG: FGGY-family carbohydrate kinase [Prochloron sp. SP5CPC1]|nr:FGGY-family carbohydrate kinase [Candidatus Paraprochloron terpiosi SP5CPC1]